MRALHGRGVRFTPTDSMWQQVQSAAAGSSSSRRRDEGKLDDNCTSESTLSSHHIAILQPDCNQAGHQRESEVVPLTHAYRVSPNGCHDARAERRRNLAVGAEHSCSGISQDETGPRSFMPVAPALHGTLSTATEYKTEFRCVKVERGQLDDMQTLSSLENRSSVILEAANASNTHHIAGETLFRNCWSRPKKRKAESTDVVTSPAHESPTKRKLASLESDIIIINQVERFIEDNLHSSSTSSDITSELIMADQESSKSSTEEEVSGFRELFTVVATTSITPTEPYQHFSLRPAGKKAKVQAEVPELCFQHRVEAHMTDLETPLYQETSGVGGEVTTRPGPPERQFYPQCTAIPVGSELKKDVRSQLRYQTDEQLDVDMETSSQARAGGSSGSGSGSKRGLEEPSIEEWLQLGLGGTSSKTPGSSRSVVPQFEASKAPVSRSPSTPSRRFSPRVPPDLTQRLGHRHRPREPGPAEINLPFSLSMVPAQGQSSTCFPRERLERGPVNFLPGLGVTASIPSSQTWLEPQSDAQVPGPPHGSKRVVPPIPGSTQQGNNSTLARATADQSPGAQQRYSQQQTGTRSGRLGFALQWTSRDPSVDVHPAVTAPTPMYFPFPERGPLGDSASRMAGRQSFGPGQIAPGQGSSHREEFSHLTSGFPSPFPYTRDTGHSLPWRDQSGAGPSGPPRPQTSDRTSSQEHRSRLPWSNEMPNTTPQCILLPPGDFSSRTGGPQEVSTKIHNVEGQFRAWERLLDRVGQAANVPFPLGGERLELQDVNLAYRRQLDQAHSFSEPPPGSWITKERARADLSTRVYEGGAGTSRKGQIPGSISLQGWPPTPEGSNLHLSPGSGRHQLQEQELSRTAATPNLPNPGLWFRLQAAEPTATQARDQLHRGYIRVMDESMPVSMVQKYLAKKLGLADASRVDISCNGNEVQPSLSLQLVRDQLWRTGSTPPTTSPVPPSSSESLMRQGEIRENCDGSFTSPKDVIMLLTYRLQPQPPSQTPQHIHS